MATNAPDTTSSVFPANAYLHCHYDEYGHLCGYWHFVDRINTAEIIEECHNCGETRTRSTKQESQ
jgi:hypothetical protein